MKKLIIFFLCLALLFSISAPALATSGNTTGPQNIDITTSVDETYTIVIPAAKTLTWGSTEAQAFGSVGLSAAKLLPTHQVTIVLSGADYLLNQADNTKTIPYAVKNGSNPFTTANFVNTINNIDLTILVEASAWNTAPAGNYSDTVTFTASVTNITTP